MGSRLRSLYERRFRRDEQGSELILEDGEPMLVVSRGELVGYRCKDGSVWRPPEQPVGEWLDEDWGDTEWVLVGGRWRERWR